MFIAGGVESMTRAPYVMLKPEAGLRARRAPARRHHARLAVRQPEARRAPSPVLDGRDGRERGRAVVRDRARARTRSRCESQQRAVAGDRGGPVRRRRSCRSTVPSAKGEATVVTRDEHPRAGHDGRGAGEAAAAFRDGGSVTAGNSSGINDGARRRCWWRRTGRASWGCGRWRASWPRAVAGVDPAVMGIGPVPATRKALVAGRPVGRRPRPGRAQRGVRLAIGRLHRRAWARPGKGQRERRRDRARAPAGHERRAAGHDARPRAGADRRTLRPGDDVHRRRPGHRHGPRADRGLPREPRAGPRRWRGRRHRMGARRAARAGRGGRPGSGLVAGRRDIGRRDRRRADPADPDLGRWYEHETRPYAPEDRALVQALGGRVGVAAMAAGRRRPLGWVPSAWLLCRTAEAMVRRAARPPRGASTPATGGREIAPGDDRLIGIGSIARAARTPHEEAFLHTIRTYIAPAVEWSDRLS